MKTKQVIILAIILAVLVAGIFFKQRQKPAEFVSEEYAALNLSFDAAQAAGIEISKGKSEPAVRLVKQNDRWTVSNFSDARADQKKIDSLLKAIREAKGELRGKDKSLFSDFGIGDDAAYRLRISDPAGKAIFTVLIGTKKPAHESVFLRQDGSDLVYLSTANLFAQMGLWGDPAEESLKVDYWPLLNLVDLKVDQVERLETKRFFDGKETLTAGVVREAVVVDGREADPGDATKKKWRYSSAEVPFAVDVEKVKQFLTSLNNLQGTKALDPKAKDYGLTKPRWQMTLGLEGGDEIVLTASGLDAETKASFIQITGQPVVFQFPDYHFQDLDIDDSRFFADNPLSVVPEKIEKLTIHTDAKELTFAPKEKKSDALTSYLNDLKTFSVARLLFDPAERKSVQSPGRFWIEVQKEGSTSLINVGSMISEEKKQYAARKRDNTQPFAISETVYKKLFDNLDRLKE